MAVTTQIQDIAPKILSRKGQYSPLSVGYEDIFGRLSFTIDGLTTISLFDNQAIFFTELVSNTAPRRIQSGLGVLYSCREQLRQKKTLEEAKRKFKIGNQINLLLVVPYVTEEIKKIIQEMNDFSVLDLCGNYIIKSKNLSAVRLDSPNEFPDNKPIQNIYKGTSSLVARTFLEGRQEYESLTSLAKEVGRLGCPATLATVSKVVSALESDLIVNRNEKSIKLLQADKLLEKLLENFSKPFVNKETRLKVDDPMSFAEKVFSKQDRQQCIFSGESSIQKHVIATQPQIYVIYTEMTVPNQAFEDCGASIDSRFFNVVIQTVTDFGVYFAPLKEGRINWAGNVQTYLELMISDKRGKELAEPLRDIILKGAT